MAEKIDLVDFFTRKKKIEEDLAKELLEKHQELIKMIPPDANEYIINSSILADDWLTFLYSNTRSGSSNSDKIKDLNEYGFSSKADAIRKLKLLKEAWKDEVEVKICTKDWYVRVDFRLAGYKKE